MTLNTKTFQKILYINLAFIGDIILSTPTIRALRKRYPQAQIHLLVTPWSKEAAMGNPYVDQVYEYDKKGKHRNIKALWSLITMLRREKYDLIISANFAVRGALLAFLLGAKIRLGYDTQHAGLFLTHTASSKRTVIKHESENQTVILEPLEINAEDFSLEFRYRETEMNQVKDKLNAFAERKKFAICPFGRYPLKNWTEAGYVGILRRLAEEGQCFLIGGPGDKMRLDELNYRAGNQAVVLAGTLSIGELAAFFALCDVLVTVDTGPMHLAGAVGLPIVALFGPTDFRVWGPKGPKDVLLKAEMPCVPCIVPKECIDYSCMKQITVEQVLDAVWKIVKKESKKSYE